MPSKPSISLFTQVLAERRKVDFNTYRGDSTRIKQDANIEMETLAGGYSYRQVLELVQNGADAILEAFQAGSGKGRILVRLDENYLSVANTGAPLSPEGLIALLTSHNSPKRNNQIGRFGLGFKSLLKLDGRILLFSKNGGVIEFNPARCREEIRKELQLPADTPAPGLRLAWPLEKENIAPEVVSLWDECAWAETLVCAEFGGKSRAKTHEMLQGEMAEFRPEFLLFSPASMEIEMQANANAPEKLSVEKSGSAMQLTVGGQTENWHVVTRDIRITDEAAKEDATHVHHRETVPLSWAFPLDARRQEAGRFWAFFPTSAETKIAGILNAPWKLNSDRTAPITGAWNTALMQEAAGLIVETLPQLVTAEDPGRPLDAFPRRTEAKELATPLVEALWREIESGAVIPDANGKLRKAEELYLFPNAISAEKETKEIIETCLPLLPEETKAQLVHPTCFLNRDRKGRLDGLASRLKKEKHESPDLRTLRCVCLISQTASTDIQKSKSLLVLLKQIHEKISPENWKALVADKLNTTSLIPSTEGKLECINNLIIGPEKFGGKTPVAAELAADEECAKILTGTLGIRKADDTRAWEERLAQSFRNAQSSSDGNLWKHLWRELRIAPKATAMTFVEKNKSGIWVKRRDGNWCVAQKVLLPGGWIKEDDKENSRLLIDNEAHAEDSEFVRQLGVLSAPELAYSDYHEFKEIWAYEKVYQKSPIIHPLFKELRGEIKRKLTRGYITLFQEKNCPLAITYRQNRRYDSETTRQHPFLVFIRDNGDLSQVFVASNKENISYVNGCNLCAFWLPETEKKSWLAKGACDLEKETEPRWDKIKESDGIISLFPEFAELLGECEHPCKVVTSLTLRIAETSAPIHCFYWWADKLLYIDREALEKLLLEERYRRLLSEIKNAGWIDGEVEENLRKIYDREVVSRREKVKACATLQERLLEAVGNDEKRLRAALGVIGSAAFTSGSKPLQLAKLVLAQFGTAALGRLTEAMSEAGLDPPKRWGTDAARKFVADIGFPPEYTLAESSRREAEVWISGPIPLPDLHDFQSEVKEGLEALVQKSATRRRAVVCLPTGGGKTRVTVEAAVEFVLKSDGTSRSVIWIAQTDELCEQAVQSFRQVWLNRGTERTDLRICRLWGSNPTPDIPDASQPVVVVASIQTLNNRVGSGFLEKLQKPGLLVVDECHHAITKSYTSVLRWLDAEAPMPWEKPEDLVAKKEPPIIGLSATPFRGNIDQDTGETERLAKRFDKNILPKNQEQLDSKLLTDGVLAKISAEEIPSEQSLTPDEERKIEEIINTQERQNADFAIDRFLENEVDKRLSEVEARNQVMVDFIKHAGEKHVLFFANSVRHAEEMAARLTLKDVPAAPISGNTPRNARRDFLERFQRGEIHVLCNHSILTTGFDAPKTDMIFISRNIFSPVRYMQIVGRGLRGPKNGGTARCRVVTMRDNLGRFDRKHAYHYFMKHYQDYISPKQEYQVS
jgi:superfamily II DNA or RNA helicase